MTIEELIEFSSKFENRNVFETLDDGERRRRMNLLADYLIAKFPAGGRTSSEDPRSVIMRIKDKELLRQAGAEVLVRGMAGKCNSIIALMIDDMMSKYTKTTDFSK